MTLADLTSAFDFILKVTAVAGVLNGALYLVLKGRFLTRAEADRQAENRKQDDVERQKSVDGLAARVTAIEGDLKQLPSKDDFHAMKLELAEVLTELRETRAEARGTKEILLRVEQQVSDHTSIFVEAARRRSG